MSIARVLRSENGMECCDPNSQGISHMNRDEDSVQVGASEAWLCNSTRGWDCESWLLGANIL